MSKRTRTKVIKYNWKTENFIGESSIKKLTLYGQNILVGQRYETLRLILEEKLLGKFELDAGKFLDEGLCLCYSSSADLFHAVASKITIASKLYGEKGEWRKIRLSTIYLKKVKGRPDNRSKSFFWTGNTESELKY